MPSVMMSFTQSNAIGPRSSDPPARLPKACSVTSDETDSTIEADRTEGQTAEPVYSFMKGSCLRSNLDAGRLG
jgi:hypothetical protein